MNFPVGRNEAERLQTLHDLHILDTDADSGFEDLTALAQALFDVPMVAVSLVDRERQWFKSHRGVTACETSRDVAFCNYTILEDALFEVEDAAAHPDFRDNPLVTGEPLIRYYCGAPIKVRGFRLGAFCIIDIKPRPALEPAFRGHLQRFANLAASRIQMQRLIKESAGELLKLTVIQGMGAAPFRSG